MLGQGSPGKRPGLPQRNEFGIMAELLKKQRLLIATGFLIVAVGAGSEFLVGSVGAPGIYGWSYEIFGTAYTIGYALLAWATWALFKWIEGFPTPGAGLTKALKLFGVANLVFGLGLVSVTYYWAYEAISHLPYVGRAEQIIPFTGGLQLLGFCLVSVGFWSAASKLQTGALKDTTEQADIGTYV
jgi:hypothetical protein